MSHWIKDTVPFIMPQTRKRSPMMQARLNKNRQQIIQAARQLIAQGGFKEAQISAIAEHAGLSTGLIYRYFSSKSQLMVEILTHAVEHEIALITALAARSEYSVQDNLAAAIQSFVGRALNGAMLAYAFMAEPVDLDIEIERIHCRQLFADAFKAILMQGQAEKTFTVQDIDVTAACIVGAMTEAVINPITPNSANKRNHAQIISNTVEFCLHGLTQASSEHPPKEKS